MLSAGTLVDNRFEILSLLGKGGFGEVYLTRQIQLDRKVALKLLRADIADQASIARFEREAKALSDLRHPNIAMFVAYGVWGTDRFTALEYVEGRSLANYVTTSGALKSSTTRQLAIEILEGLTHAHAHGIVHRDLKPANIIISDDLKTVKIIDFGLAQIYSKQRLTQEGLAVGTLQYMSPEQCLGQQLDARADLYSLGCIMFECLTGTAAFNADDAVTIMAQQINERRTLVASGNDLANFVNTLLEKHPADRFASADEALRTLKAIKVDDSVLPISSEREAVGTPKKSRATRAATIMACALVAIVSAGAIAVTIASRSELPSEFDFGRPVGLESGRFFGQSLHDFLSRRLERVNAALAKMDNLSPSQRLLAQRRIEDELQQIWLCRVQKERTPFLPALDEELSLPWSDPSSRKTAALAVVGVKPTKDPRYESCVWQATRFLNFEKYPHEMMKLQAGLVCHYADKRNLDGAQVAVDKLKLGFDRLRKEADPAEDRFAYDCLSAPIAACEERHYRAAALQLYLRAIDIVYDQPLSFDTSEIAEGYYALLKELQHYGEAKKHANRMYTKALDEKNKEAQEVWDLRRA